VSIFFRLSVHLHKCRNFLMDAAAGRKFNV